MTICSVTVDVDVDLSEISDEDLIAELESRDIDVVCDMDSARLMFEAFKVGNHEEAIRLARKIAEAATGGILT